MPRKRVRRKANQRKLRDKKNAKTFRKSSRSKRHVTRRRNNRIRRRIKGRNVSKNRRRKSSTSSFRKSTQFLKQLLRRKQYVNKPVGNKYDGKNKIFFSGASISRRKYQTIAYLIRVQITGYAEVSKSVLWWRRIKAFKPQTLKQWSKTLKEPMYIGAIEDQVEQSHASFIELIGLEGVK